MCGNSVFYVTKQTWIKCFQVSEGLILSLPFYKHVFLFFIISQRRNNRGPKHMTRKMLESLVLLLIYHCGIWSVKLSKMTWQLDSRKSGICCFKISSSPVLRNSLHHIFGMLGRGRTMPHSRIQGWPKDKAIQVLTYGSRILDLK